MLGINGRRFFNKIFLQILNLNLSKLLMENTTAIAYINRMGDSFPMLASLAYEIWQWCLQREISLTAHHVPGIYKNAADRESTADRDLSDLKPDPTIFARLNKLWSPLEVELFAARFINQLPRFCEMESRSRRGSYRRFLSWLASDKGLCINPFRYRRSSLLLPQGI